MKIRKLFYGQVTCSMALIFSSNVIWALASISPNADSMASFIAPHINDKNIVVGKNTTLFFANTAENTKFTVNMQSIDMAGMINFTDHVIQGDEFNYNDQASRISAELVNQKSIVSVRNLQDSNGILNRSINRGPVNQVARIANTGIIETLDMPKAIVINNSIPVINNTRVNLYNTNTDTNNKIISISNIVNKNDILQVTPIIPKVNFANQNVMPDTLVTPVIDDINDGVVINDIPVVPVANQNTPQVQVSPVVGDDRAEAMNLLFATPPESPVPGVNVDDNIQVVPVVNDVVVNDIPEVNQMIPMVPVVNQNIPLQVIPVVGDDHAEAMNALFATPPESPVPGVNVDDNIQVVPIVNDVVVNDIPEVAPIVPVVNDAIGQ